MQEQIPAPGQVKVYVVDAAAAECCSSRLSNNLSQEDLARLGRYTNLAARSMFSASRGGLRQLLGEMLAEPAPAIRIASHEHGKPYLPDFPELHFNISHSRTLALIAIARHPVGVDVEYLHRSVDFASILRRFFSPSEQADWEKYPVPSPVEAFFRGWTRKEAILKATGEGIAGLGHTIVSFQPGREAALIERMQDPAEADRWRFNDFCPAPGYQAAVAMLASSLQLEIKNFTMQPDQP